MSFDRSRFEREKSALAAVFGGAARTFQIVGAPPDRWSSFGADLRFGSRVIRGLYAVDFPYRAPHIIVTPPPRSRHYYDHHEGLDLGPTLCLMRREEMNPQYSMATCLWIAIRFLNQLDNGIAD